MKTPKRIEPLIEDGLVDQVLRQLMSGKEATVYVVQCGDEVRCAKVYKEANQRGFHQAVHYTEGRKVKNSRAQRAMEKVPATGEKNRSPPGNAPRSMPCISSPLPACEFRIPLVFTKVCC